MNDPVLTNPELYSVVFENARVRVLRYHDRPGDRTRPHQRQLIHGDRSVAVTLSADEIRWLDAQEHSGQNIGSTDSMALFVELKEPASVTTQAGQLGPRT
jgi:beta-alanine degradation protein BauB